MAHLLNRPNAHSAVRIESSEKRSNGINVYKIAVRDGYDGWADALERKFSRLFADQLDRYLKKRPSLEYEHPSNLARKVLYAIPAFSAWSKYMPGALALEPIYNPELKRLENGKKIDVLTRGLFRHGLDPVGIRTRTVTGSWLVIREISESRRSQLRWLSLAGGTLMPTLLMLHGSCTDIKRCYVTNVDIDETALARSKKEASYSGIPEEHIVTIAADVTDCALLKQMLNPDSYDVIDMMGLLEYLNDADASELLSTSYDLARPGGIILFGNMRRKHPQIDLHKRGVGWPGVRPRSVAMICELITATNIPLQAMEVYQPADGVYTILSILKA